MHWLLTSECTCGLQVFPPCSSLSLHILDYFFDCSGAISFMHSFIHSFLVLFPVFWGSQRVIIAPTVQWLQFTWNGACMWCNAKLNSLLLHIDLFLSTITLICGLHLSSLFSCNVSMSVIPAMLISYNSFGCILKSESVMPPVLYFFVED